MSAKNRSATARVRIRVAAIWRKRWVRLTALALAIPTVVVCFLATYYYVSFAHLIDARLHGERDHVFPRVHARPLELHRGQSLTARQLVDQLNDIGYAERARPDKAGEFSVSGEIVMIRPRGADFNGQ